MNKDNPEEALTFSRSIQGRNRFMKKSGMTEPWESQESPRRGLSGFPLSTQAAPVGGPVSDCTIVRPAGRRCGN